MVCGVRVVDGGFLSQAEDGIRVGHVTGVQTCALPISWAGFVFVAFVLDVFAQRIVGWHASSSMRVDLVMTPLRIALWQRDREGNPISPGCLIHHSDAGAIGRAHVLTPVTWPSRMPSSA